MNPLTMSELGFVEQESAVKEAWDVPELPREKYVHLPIKKYD